MNPTPAATECPSCGLKGRKIKPITAESLLSNAARERWRAGGAESAPDATDAPPLRFCRTPTCDVVYFGGIPSQRFTTADVRVPVFQKATDPDRLVCYCFDHSVAAVEADATAPGGATIPASIAAACKAGLDHCREKNPQGSCCLGNISAVGKAAVLRAAGEPEAIDAGAALTAALATGCDVEDGGLDCCGGDKGAPNLAPSVAGREAVAAAQTGGVNPGALSAVGAVFAALLASACCWLPLALIGLGGSALGVAGFFETYRLLFLGITAVLLAGGFYYVYFRTPACAPGDACAVPNPNLQRVNKISLWFATGLVVVFASFPSYVGALIDDGGASAAVAGGAPGEETRTYGIVGMTCEGCTKHISSAVSKVPGVKAVKVDYKAGTAVVLFAAGEVDDAAVTKAVLSTGYEMKP